MKTNNARQKIFMRVIPPLVGVFLVLLFARLGFWQLDRAQQKIETQRAFERAAENVQIAGDLVPVPFQGIKSQGRYLADNQFVIDNAIQSGRLGYYVISPFEYSAVESLLLVNRGWIQRDIEQSGLPDIEIPHPDTSITGKAGLLPRVAIRPGDAFMDHESWPRIGVWPTADDIATELGRDVLPYVLLLNPDQKQGYLRHWQPPQAGPSMHYGYAFQWFAMAITIMAIMLWNLRKRAKKHAS